jgi:kynurenine formamidase
VVVLGKDMKLIDLSHTIAPGMPMFSPSAPKPEIKAWMSHQQAAKSGKYEDCTCEISEVQFVTSLGTYLDSPYHFNPEGDSIEALDLYQLVLPGLVIDCRPVDPRQPIGPELLSDVDLTGKAVLFRTDWSRYWGKPRYQEFPFLTRETAEALRDGGAKLAGVDFLVIDDTTDPQRPVHVTLLNSNILIVENLTNLAALPSKGFTFHATPVKFKGAAAFPVRAYAEADEV